MKFNRLCQHLYADETETVQHLLKTVDADAWKQNHADSVQEKTQKLVEGIRKHKRKPGELDSFMQQYGLNTDEGLALMTLAEALLRVPDSNTANLLIRDKVTAAQWLRKAGTTKDWLVKAAGVGLSVSRATFESVLAKLGEPMIRQATLQAMRILGHQFVLGRSIDEAMERGQEDLKKGYRFSYDMLGEGARTYEDAEKYYASYAEALRHLAANSSGIEQGRAGRLRKAGISVKLSALHPRYEYARAEECVPVLVEKMTALCKHAREADLNLTIDAEEADRLEISLEIFERLCDDSALKDWEGLGLAVQAYQKRCLPLIDHLKELAQSSGRKIQVRLVKGAYWDTEIKYSQVEGVPDFPVFTRKLNTDLSFIACARKLLEKRDVFYPMLATHNAHTVLSCLEMAGGYESGDFEFQRLHGMGEALYDILRGDIDVPVSIYAPVGTHKDLLPYLVRRLLENGANSSFVNRIADHKVPVAEVFDDPILKTREQNNNRHSNIRLPRELYGESRKNAIGLDLNDDPTVQMLLKGLQSQSYRREFYYEDLVPCRKDRKSKKHRRYLKSYNPANVEDCLGQVPVTTKDDVNKAFESAKNAWRGWGRLEAERRAEILEKIADLYEDNMDVLIGLCCRDGGRTIRDAMLEVREAVDFCRYYAAQAREDFKPQEMPGPTGESNIYSLGGRGVFVCISPGNFPLAIFTGQIVAALVTGNAVIAKPAEQTPFVAAMAVKYMYSAGVPTDVLHLIPGDGEVGAMLVEHPDVAGVAFTGSTQTARKINQTLAQKSGPIVPFIAETGGQNAMIIDSSALTEQVVDDLVQSAFYSAGQRCSAARIALVQEDVADKTLKMLSGAIEALEIGDPSDLSTDIGPVIDDNALQALEDHRHALERMGKQVKIKKLDPDLKEKGSFFPPCVYEINSIDQLREEHFGPILHIIRFKAEEFDNLAEKINQTGYGLTFGIHSRIESRYHDIVEKIQAGNCYVNRSITAAVVGVQPFGGRNLSGTGPKAGGPHYLKAFVNEKTVTINTAAVGGNASLVGLEE